VCSNPRAQARLRTCVEHLIRIIVEAQRGNTQRRLYTKHRWNPLHVPERSVTRCTGLPRHVAKWGIDSGNGQAA
jgi:hypothetical protein